MDGMKDWIKSQCFSISAELYKERGIGQIGKDTWLKMKVLAT